MLLGRLRERLPGAGSGFGVSFVPVLPLIVACKAADLVFNSPFFALLSTASLLKEILAGTLGGPGWDGELNLLFGFCNS